MENKIIEGNTSLLFDEYKAGFNEIEKLVQSFSGISNGSQIEFINSKMEILDSQLKTIELKRIEVTLHIKQELVRCNSELFTLKNLEEHILKEKEATSKIMEVIKGNEK